MKIVLLLLYAIISISNAFYLPGLAPVNYCKKGEATQGSCRSDIPVYVNRLNSEETVIPYEYNYFDFCQADDDAKSPSENLGQVVFGERIRPSPYSIPFLEEKNCVKLCTKTYRPDDEGSDSRLMVLKHGIDFKYQHHWIVDNLPVIWCLGPYCTRGFPMGCYMSGVEEADIFCKAIVGDKAVPHTYYLFNHVDLTIGYHSGELENWGSKTPENSGRIIGEVQH